MDDDFKDVLSIFSDEPEKTEPPAAEEAKPAEEKQPEAVPAAAPGGLKKPVPGKGFQRPMPGGKFARPQAPGATGKAPTPAAPAAAPAPPPPSPALQPPAAPFAAMPILPTAPPAKTGNPFNRFLLILVVIFSLISLLVSAAALSKVSGMRTEMKLLNEHMKEVRISADRAWQIKCGIFVPVPNQRPQEYMIRYEEKNGQLFKKDMITRPVE
ncbi:MAG: hypothetical protein GX927_02780 [Lentisphaerae bacterium]|nr:hypothetical protein [Lentisphaerota bacterium]